MTNEKSFFLQILSDHLNGRTTAAKESVDWSVVATLAQNHQVNGIVYSQCKDFLPDEVREKLRKKYSSELYYYYNREALYKQVQEAFSAAQIPFYTVKGLTIARYYPIPALRTMGDCDIVVHPEDKEKAHDVMLELGFDNHLKGEKEWVYFKNKMEFELHDHLLYDDIGNSESSRILSDRTAWERSTVVEGSCHELDMSSHIVFLLLHLKKHIIHCGIGFRQFMDLAVVMRRCDLDWPWIQETLEEQGIKRFFQVCLALLKRWFGIASPFEPAELDAAFYEEATDNIFENGVFGLNDESNHDNKLISSILERRGPFWWHKFRLLAGSAFPSYQDMRLVPYYAFLDRRPWLLPVAWLYRFYRSIRYRLSENGKHMLEKAMIPNERLESRKKTLAEWGL